MMGFSATRKTGTNASEDLAVESNDWGVIRQRQRPIRCIHSSLSHNPLLWSVGFMLGLYIIVILQTFADEA
jgi:hypothetical protein